MARDDYYVIVYQILAYLYQCLKKGEDVDVNQISARGGQLIDINESYWKYIMINLATDSYIKGIKKTGSGKGVTVVITKDIQITPKGIEYQRKIQPLKKQRNFLKI